MNVSSPSRNLRIVSSLSRLINVFLCLLVAAIGAGAIWLIQRQCGEKHDSTVILSSSSTVFAAVPGWKPIYVFDPSITDFRGSAYPNNFDFEIRDGNVTVKGRPWIGHMAGCGVRNQYVVWDDNLVDNRDVDRANQIAYGACDTVGYIVPISHNP